MTRIQKAKDLASQSYLGLWGSLPNPNRDFFQGKGVSFERAMREVSSLAEVEAAIIARKNAVLADEWQVVGKNDASAQWITDNLNELDPVYTFNAIFDAVWQGYAVLDIPLVKRGGRWVYQNIQSLPCDWFSFDRDGNLLFSRGEDTARAPVNLTIGDLEKEAELVQYYPSYTNPYGESQLARVFWPATWLRGNMEYWSSYISRFADDSILAHTDGANPAKKAELLRAIMDFRSSGGLVTEGTETFEVLNTNKSASSMLFKDFAQACRESISKLILGHASALDSTPGKLGGEDNVALVREDIQQGDKRLIAGVMNALIRHLCLVNTKAGGRRYPSAQDVHGSDIPTDIPEFVWVPEAEDEKALIERDKKLWDMGVRFTPEYIQKAYRLEEKEFTVTAPTQINNTPAFADRGTDAEDAVRTGSEGGRHPNPSNKYTAPLDALEEGHFKGFYKPFNSYNKRLLTALENAEYWEDAYAALLETPLETDGLQFHQDLLNAHIIGRGQVLNRIAELKKESSADFAETPQYLDTTATARNWFTKKTAMTAESFAKLDDELKQYSFTVAGLEKTEHISALAQKLTEAFNSGASYTTFKKSLRAMDGEGADAAKDGKVSAYGLAPEIDALADSRLRMVYRQNIFAAYSEGRYKQMMESVEYLPNWEYITIGDGRVRPAHAALSGTVRRYDDPFWNTWYPPNGFNCRCVVEVTTKEPSGSGTPVWNKKLADKAMEAGSPMREIDRAQGKLSPDKGFDRNDAGMSRWIGEKGEQAVKKALAFGVDNASKAGVRTQLLKTTEVPIRWDESKNILVKDNITTQNAVEIIQKQVNADSIILDFDGAPVYVDAKEILKHITDKKDKAVFEARKVILPKIKEILSNPQEARGQFEKYPGKNGTLVFAKKYLATVNGEPHMLVVEFIKEGKDKGVPVLTTVYKINNPEVLKEKRTGVLLK